MLPHIGTGAGQAIEVSALIEDRIVEANMIF